MDNESIELLCGEGEAMDEFTAASLGLLNLIEEGKFGKSEESFNSSCSKPDEQDNLKNGERDKWSVLMFAIYYQRKNIINYLTSAPLVETSNNRPLHNNNLLTTTPLSLAVLSGDMSLVQQLYMKENLDLKDPTDRTALYLAVETNQFEMATFLLEKGSSTDIICDGTSCLGKAARQGNACLVKLLLKAGAQICLPDQIKGPVMMALENGSMEIASLLLNTLLESHGLEEIFKQVNLHKYWPVFQEEKIDYEKFLQLTEADVRDYGISLLGPRKKISLLISLMKSTK